MEYLEFKDLVRAAGERRANRGGLVPIPDLRRECAEVEHAAFDQYVLALHREGAIHLLSHVEQDTLTAEVREQCVVHPSGTLLYWLRWL